MRKCPFEMLSELAGGKEVKILSHWTGGSGGFTLWWMDGKTEKAIQMDHVFDAFDWENVDRIEPKAEEFVGLAEQAIEMNQTLIAANDPKRLRKGFLILGAKGNKPKYVSIRMWEIGEMETDLKKRWDEATTRIFEMGNEQTRILAAINPPGKQRVFEWTSCNNVPG